MQLDLRHTWLATQKTLMEKAISRRDPFAVIDIDTATSRATIRTSLDSDEVFAAILGIYASGEARM